MELNSDVSLLITHHMIRWLETRMTRNKPEMPFFLCGLLFFKESSLPGVRIIFPHFYRCIKPLITVLQKQAMGDVWCPSAEGVKAFTSPAFTHAWIFLAPFKSIKKP